VAAFASWHALHDDAVGALEAGAQLPVHAAFETYSVLTRLPPPARATPPDVIAFLRSWFDVPYPSLGATELGDLLRDLPARGIAGGATYDALIAAVAVAHGAPLVTCDRRALATYSRFDLTVDLLE
jgi:predicted nucleic acid-binding protein